MSHADKAVELFKQGYNCSQSVFAAYAQDYGFDLPTALKLSASFGGGVARMREICGCVSGMAMVAGLETGAVEGRDREGKARNYEIVQQMAQKFRERSGGSIICKELLGLSKPEGSPVPEERTAEYYKKRPCNQLIAIACEIIDETFFNKCNDEMA